MKKRLQAPRARFAVDARALTPTHCLCLHDEAGSELKLPRISVVIPVRNDATRLERCLISIRQNEYPSELIEIIVADNGSIDGSPAVARQFGARVLDLPRVNVARLRNEATRQATGEIIAFIDADHEIDRRWFISAADVLSDESVFAVGASPCSPPGGTWVQRQYDALRGPTRRQSDTYWLGSGNLAIPRGAFMAAGGFDESLETCEDVDLCRRLRNAGGRLLADERLRSIHFGDPETLWALLRGELWRGRDNIRVSLRPPVAIRALPSVVIPVADLVFLFLLVAGLFVPAVGFRVAVVGAMGFLGLAFLRTAKILANLEGRTAIDLHRAFMVAASYDLGRSFAVLTRASHGIRRVRDQG